ncbi:Asp23/Gls24 family envelope stress response protein [Amycolatopsis sp. 195334CR]|uniref:Asp23/Gls24 family envelope stress response protein n=1 Tax=Amycolatopsis sp. 195334CR TaxID=2814588 RepID=UPI0027DB77B8|nr:Asp23/Gls24 family envelope stress response protein [Amycolatopsis sp. 195334CR]
MDTEDRGTLTIEDRVVERIATRAVSELDGTDQPAKVRARVTGDSATLDVRLALSYPVPVASTTENARRHLRHRVGELAGLTVSRVDITVAALRTSAAEPRRVR